MSEDLFYFVRIYSFLQNFRIAFPDIPDCSFKAFCCCIEGTVANDGLGFSFSLASDVHIALLRLLYSKKTPLTEVTWFSKLLVVLKKFGEKESKFTIFEHSSYSSASVFAKLEALDALCGILLQTEPFRDVLKPPAKTKKKEASAVVVPLRTLPFYTLKKESTNFWILGLDSEYPCTLLKEVTALTDESETSSKWNLVCSSLDDLNVFVSANAKLHPQLISRLKASVLPVEEAKVKKIAAAVRRERNIARQLGLDVVNSFREERAVSRGGHRLRQRASVKYTYDLESESDGFTSEEEGAEEKWDGNDDGDDGANEDEEEEGWGRTRRSSRLQTQQQQQQPRGGVRRSGRISRSTGIVRYSDDAGNNPDYGAVGRKDGRKLGEEREELKEEEEEEEDEGEVAIVEAVPKKRKFVMDSSSESESSEHRPATLPLTLHPTSSPVQLDAWPSHTPFKSTNPGQDSDGFGTPLSSSQPGHLDRGKSLYRSKEDEISAYFQLAEKAASLPPAGVKVSKTKPPSKTKPLFSHLPARPVIDPILSDEDF